MHWKLKAIIQNAIAVLPSSASYAAYYWTQRRIGALRKIDPTGRLVAGIEICQRIRAQGRNPVGGVFLEVGTGRVPFAPLAYWLMGAEETFTLDLNRYLREELVEESVRQISRNWTRIEQLFGGLIITSRFKELQRYSQKREFTTHGLLDLCRIKYLAPANAATTQLPDKSIDFHTSYTVLEHIPPAELRNILREGRRLLRERGLFVHLVDYSDHFSHSDPKISAINFLQYSDRTWSMYAGNRYMYMNRLRHDDFVDLFSSESRRLLDIEPYVDPRSEQLLASGRLQLNEKFESKSRDTLSVSSSWFVSTP